MPTTNPLIDAYIDKAEEFAKPVLNHLRKLVHTACPDVEEKIKWGFPNFIYKKEILCSMAAFKNHCAFTFWKAALMKDNKKILEISGKTAMGHFGKITSLQDLPSDAIIKSYIKEAMALNDADVKLPKTKKVIAETKLIIPEYFQKRLNKNKIAKATFEKMPPSHKKESLEWITEAKTETTREKRISTTLEWLEEGKSRNWRYEKS
ncbi:MAG: YdeI/OmpD-associated family protein [Bacteroidetes bacterium]|nr:YdeI/OmpD-associated family protein [Bacteroidota bacterium]